MRENNFDLLRFYFAFIVVIGHLIVISKVPDFKCFTPYFNTYTSVTAFFCISGFLIARSYQCTSSVKIFLKKRAARLLPAYICVILLSSLIFSTLSTYRLSDYFTNPELFKYLIANLSFLNFAHPELPGVFIKDGLTPDINGALWTLKVEVSFYLTVPLLIYFTQKTKRKYLLFILIYILSVLYKNSLEHYAALSENGLYAIIARQLPGFMSYFICGVALSYYFEQFQRSKRWLFILGLCLYIFEQKIGWEVFSPLSLSLIVFTVAYSLKGFNSFGKYGDISYGIYIFHCPIIKTATYLGFFNRYNPFLVAIVVILIVLFVGFLSWHFVEKSFLQRAHSIRSTTTISS